MLEGIGAILFCIVAFFAFGVIYSYVSKIVTGTYGIVISLFIITIIGYVMFNAIQ